MATIPDGGGALPSPSPAQSAREPSGPPRSPSLDADSTWLARGVRLIGWSIVVALAVVLLRGALLGTAAGSPATAVLLGGIIATGFSLWLNWRGRSRRAARVLAFTIPVLAFGLALWTGRGFRDPAILMMPATLILASVLLDRRALAAAIVVTVGATTGLLVAEWHGWVPGSEGLGIILEDILDSAVILTVTGIIAGALAGHLRRGIEALRRQEAALRESEVRYRALVDLAADAIVLGSPSGGITEANRRATELTGYPPPEILGRPLESLFSPAELARAPFDVEAVARGETVVKERVLTRKDGREVPVEMSSKQMPDGTRQSILRDVGERHRAEAERRSLEARLRQAQKMEAIGRLAGGIAHDFNNLLSAITGSLTLALRNVPEGSPARRWLAEVDRSSWRAAALTRHLLTFSRQQVIEPKVLDLRPVVQGMGSLVARTIGEDVRLQVRLADEPCHVRVDHSQMEQVILNLVTNARDAMPDGGTLTLEVGLASPDQVTATPRGRGMVVLSATDTGHGMADGVRTRLFEPFFTTKPSGSGTGLGLAMVYGAVEQNGGWIDVDSAPGRGSTFRVWLPEAEAGPQPPSPPAPEAALRGTETVLLVEDEPAVRRVIAEQLELLGYHVLACAGAQEALTTAADLDGPLHLLLTDVVMPDMNGRELAKRLSETRRDLPVLYTSGYGEDVVARHGVVESGVLLLQKPYSLATLARQVRRALAAGPG